MSNPISGIFNGNASLDKASLDKAKRKLTPRCVRYVARIVVLNFQGKGWID